MAPEVICHEMYSQAVDIYSCGMVFYELITHHVPFNDMSELQAAACVALEGKRPSLPAGTPALLESLLSRVWATSSAERPHSAGLAAEIVMLQEQLSLAELRWLDVPEGADPPSMPDPCRVS